MEKGKLNKTSSPYAETFLEDGIIFQIIDPSVKTINLEIAKQLVKDRIEVVKNVNHPLPVLVHVNDIISVDKEARAYYATDASYEGLNATALLMDNYVIRLAVNMLILIAKPRISVAAFKDEGKALLWLEQYKVGKQN